MNKKNINKDASKEPNDKEKRLVMEYLKCFNKSEAYMRVYPKSSKETALTEGSRILGIPHILAYKNRMLNEILGNDKEELKARWENEIKEIAFSRYADYLDSSGQIDVQKLKDINPGAIAEYIDDEFFSENVQKKRISIKLHKKDKALELAGKYLSLLNERGTPESPLVLEFVTPSKPPKD